MTRTLKQSALFIGSLVLWAVTCCGSFAGGYYCGYVRGHEELRGWMSGDGLFQPHSPVGTPDIRNAFPDAPHPLD